MIKLTLDGPIEERWLSMEQTEVDNEVEVCIFRSTYHSESITINIHHLQRAVHFLVGEQARRTNQAEVDG